MTIQPTRTALLAAALVAVFGAAGPACAYVHHVALAGGGRHQVVRGRTSYGVRGGGGARYATGTRYGGGARYGGGGRYLTPGAYRRGYGWSAGYGAGVVYGGGYGYGPDVDYAPGPDYAPGADYGAGPDYGPGPAVYASDEAAPPQAWSAPPPSYGYAAAPGPCGCQSAAAPAYAAPPYAYGYGQGGPPPQGYVQDRRYAPNADAYDQSGIQSAPGCWGSGYRGADRSGDGGWRAAGNCPP